MAAGALARFEPRSRNQRLLHIAVSVLTVTVSYLLFADGLRVRFA